MKFSAELLKEFNINKKNDYSDNWDVMSRGPEPEPYDDSLFQEMSTGWRIHHREKLRYILNGLIGKFYPTQEYRIKLRKYDGIGYLHDLLSPSQYFFGHPVQHIVCTRR